MFMIDYDELGWWYWLVIVCLLTAGMLGYPTGYALGVGIAALQCLHGLVLHPGRFGGRGRSMT